MKVRSNVRDNTSGSFSDTTVHIITNIDTPRYQVCCRDHYLVVLRLQFHRITIDATNADANTADEAMPT
jgi:hypothetical protein